MTPRTDRVPSRIITLIILIAGIVILVFSRLWHLSFYSLDGDEIFSVQAARQSWSKMLEMVAIDLVHPPLFYGVLKSWMIVGPESVLWWRLLPALLGIVSVVPLIMICRELRLERFETAMVVFLFSANGFLIGYAQQVRMYSLVLFCSLVSIWLFLRCINSAGNERKTLIALFVVNLAVVYSHYYGWFVVGVESLIVLIWDRRRLVAFALMDALLAVCYIPWILAVMHASSVHALGPHINWIDPPSIRELVWFYALLNGAFEFRRSTILGLLLFGIPIVITIWTLIKTKNNIELRRLLWLCLFAFMPALLAFFISRSWRSVWGERHLIVAATPYLMLVVIGAYRLRSRLVAGIVLSAILLWSTVSGFRVIEAPERKLQWDWLVSQMLKRESQPPQTVTVFTLERFVAIPFEFHLEKQAHFRVVEVNDFGSIGERHFWVAFRNTTWKQTRQPQELLSETGYRVGEPIQITAQAQTITIFPVDR